MRGMMKEIANMLNIIVNKANRYSGLYLGLLLTQDSFSSNFPYY